MNIDEYQKKAYGFASYGGNLNYPLLGLSEETGEVCGKIAKFIRKHGGREPVNAMKADENDYRELVVDLKKELGDVLWMISAIATDFGLSMEDIASGNIVKLEDRLARGVIIGEGDNR